MSSTSFEAYDSQVRTGKARSQRERILHAIQAWPRTRNELARDLGIRLASVCGRVGELLEDGQVEVIGERVDEETGHAGEILRAREPEPKQGRLF